MRMLSMVALFGALWFSPVAEAGKLDAAEQALVGTYSNVEGDIRFVLDRFSQPPRMRMSDTKEVVQVTMIERTSRSGGWDVYDPDGTWLFFMDKNGGLMKNKVALSRMGDAKPLKKLSKSGVYVVPPTPYEIMRDKFTPMAVRTWRPDTQPEDSGNFEVLAKIFAEAPLDQFVQFGWSHEDGSSWSPVSDTIGMTSSGSMSGYFPTEETYDPNAAGLRGHGVVVEGQAYYGGRVRIVSATPKPFQGGMAAGTPGLIFEVDGATVTFVSLDGGRYRVGISGSDLEDDEAPPFKALTMDGWPEPLQHTRIDEDEIRQLSKAGILPEAAFAELDGHDDAFRSCVKASFESGEKKVAKLKKRDLGYAALQAEMEELSKSIESDASAECAVHVEAFEKALLTLVEERNAGRSDLYEKVKSRLDK